jgi:hypothetical protein
MKLKKIFSSETTEPISTKLCWNDPWVVPFQIVFVSAILYPRWPPLLKIEISSNSQNCSILSQKVSKFEVYKHNDELFNIYYGIFYELWTFAYFDRLCKLEKGGMKFTKNLLLWNYWANLNQTLLKWFLGGPLPKLCPHFRTHRTLWEIPIKIFLSETICSIRTKFW